MMRRISAISVLLAAMLFALSVTAIQAADAKAAKDKSNNGILGKVVPINEKFRDMTYKDFIAPWVQWFLNLPVNPEEVADPAIWAANQSGKVWFLGGIGTYDKPVRRSVKIPTDAAIFFPVITYSYVGWPQPPYNEPPSKGWEPVTLFMNAVVDLQCTIDGVNVPNLFQNRVISDGAPDEWSGEVYWDPASWWFDDPDTPADLFPGLYPYVADGYWLLLRPLSAGKHTIQIRGKSYVSENLGLSIDVTYDVTVGK